jgi:hypothetical protein
MRGQENEAIFAKNIKGVVKDTKKESPKGLSVVLRECRFVSKNERRKGKVRKIGLFIVLILVIGLLVGCGGSGDTGDKSPKFNPPMWIQGEWADEFGMNNYKFTNDNVIFTTEGYSMNFKETYKNVAVNETITDSLYKINVSDSGYKFEKLTSTALNYTITSSGISIGPIELIRQ